MAHKLPQVYRQQELTDGRIYELWWMRLKTWASGFARRRIQWQQEWYKTSSELMVSERKKTWQVISKYTTWTSKRLWHFPIQDFPPGSRAKFYKLKTVKNESSFLFLWIHKKICNTKQTGWAWPFVNIFFFAPVSLFGFIWAALS